MPSWRVAEDRFVGFFDIMGFKHLLDTLSPDAMYGRMVFLRDVVIECEQLAATITDGKNKSNAPTSSWQELVKIVQFSDSVVVFTKDSSPTCSLVMTLLSTKMFLNSLAQGVLLRGAISRGLVIADFERSIFFGKPIVDAYLLEEDQKWFGIVEHDSFSSLDSGEYPEIGNDEIAMSEPYRVPLKSGARVCLAINWPVYIQDFAVLEQYMSQFANNPSGKVRQYYRNTMRFAAHV